MSHANPRVPTVEKVQYVSDGAEVFKDGDRDHMGAYAISELTRSWTAGALALVHRFMSISRRLPYACLNTPSSDYDIL
jgi:hypothetical protein